MRVRLSLLRCLRQAQFIGVTHSETSTSTTNTSPIATAGDDGGGRGKWAESEKGGGRGKGAGSESTESSTPKNSVDGVSNFSERLEDYIKSLELLSQHVGTRMLRQQRSRTLVSEYCIMILTSGLHVVTNLISILVYTLIAVTIATMFSTTNSGGAQGNRESLAC